MILVTGAGGLIGRALTLQLLQAGERVRALSLDAAWLAELRALGAEPMQAPLEDAHALRRAAAGCGRVFHAAGVVSHEGRDRARLLETNGEGVRRLLEAADPDARVVVVSSASTFGPAPTAADVVDEQTQPPAWLERRPYHASKLLGERYALEAVEVGRDVVVANPAFAIGPGLRGPLARVLRLHRYGLLRAVPAGGLSYVDVRDVAQGLCRAAERGRTGERYLLASRDGNLGHRDFLALVAELADRCRRQIVVPPRLFRLRTQLPPRMLRPGEANEAGHWWFYDQGKAERELGFRVRPLAETLRDLLAELGTGPRRPRGASRRGRRPRGGADSHHTFS